MSNRTYFSVIARGKSAQAKLEAPIWSPQFGDYDRECATEEMRDMKSQHIWTGYEFRVISSGETQAAITATISKLNAKG